jgi:ABC-type glycerol-3-phosphate transport system substrate-binding protein
MTSQVTSQEGFNRRQILMMLGALGVAPVLGSCASSGSGTSASSSGTLSFTHWLGNEFAVNFDPPMAKILPKIKVNQQNVPYEGYVQKLTTEFAAGTGPNFFMWDVSWAGEAFTTKISSPWNDYLASQGHAGKASSWGQPFQMATDRPDQVVGLPVLFPQSFIVHINQELADQQGLLKDAPLWGNSNYDSWNWDKFVEWLKAATKVRRDGTVEQYGTAGVRLTAPTLLTQLVASNGGTLFSGGTPYTFTNKKCNLTDPAVIEAAQMLVDLVRVHKVAYQPAAEAQAATGDSYSGKLSLSVIQAAEASSYPVASTFPQAYMALPYFQTKVRQVGLTPWFVNKQSQNQDLSRDWIFTWSTNTTLRKLVATINSAPAYDPLPIVLGLPDGQSKTTSLVNLSRVAGHSTIPSDTIGVQDCPAYMDCTATAFAQNTITNALTAAFLGKQTVPEAFASAKSQIESQL